MKEPNYFTTTSHDFKTNFPRYARWVEERRYDAILVKRYAKLVGLYMPARPVAPQHDDGGGLFD